ncbi:MAG: DoxX family protein [Chitinophagales bacterium]
MKKAKIIYLISTGLLSLMMLMSAGMYIVKNADVSVIFSGLGFPTYIIYPLAVAKILGIIAIWTKKSQCLKEWAYAGFFFDFVLAASAHISVSDGEFIPAIVAIVLLFVSYFSEKKMIA